MSSQAVLNIKPRGSRARGLRVLGCAAALSLALAAQAFAAGPREVVGFADSDRGGASKTWELPLGQPYLYVPFVGDDLGGAVKALDVGPDLGVALFQRAFFASRDVGCTPALGTDAHPELEWLGATARFEPGSGREAGDAAEVHPKTGGYSSLIIYQKTLGPPPGLLLLDRRRRSGFGCRNALHKTFFNRLFVPVAAPPAARRCFDLAGAYRVEGSEQKVLQFNFSDRFVLLQPQDLSERYAGVAHRFTVSLFDDLGCRGQGLSFKSAAVTSRGVRLDSYEFRDRARSVLISYESGALSPYLKIVPPAAPAIAEAAPPAPKPEPQTAAAETAPPAPEPEPQTAAAETAPPAPEPKPQTAAAETAPEPPVAKPIQPAAPPETAAAEPAAPRPKVAPPGQPEAEIIWAEPAKGAPAQPEAATVQEAKAVPTPAASPEPPAAKAKIFEPAPAKTEPAPGQIQLAMPKLEPKVVPEVKPGTSASVASQTFIFPVHEIYRLNFCFNWDKDCGEPAAQAWCKVRGFNRAAAWTVDENIGSLFPTIVLGENRVCAKFVCDGFQEITCAK
ncbi:MAG: hypothetical protein V3T80_02180 [Kiloniellales bacterium]